MDGHKKRGADTGDAAISHDNMENPNFMVKDGW